jgi:glycine betaine/proline transport system permease protein
MVDQSLESNAQPTTHERGFDASAAAIGPLAAAARGLWVLFAISAFLELVGLILAGRALLPVTPDYEPRGSLWGGIILIALAHILVGTALRPLSDMANRQRSLAETDQARSPNTNLAVAAPLLIFVYTLTLYRFIAAEPVTWLASFPAPKWLAPNVASAIDSLVKWFTTNWSVFFDAITIGLRNTLNFVEAIFVDTPWPVTCLIVLLLAWRLAGPRTTIFTAASLAYIGFLGLWDASMTTLALVAVSVVICVVIGIPVGVLCAKSPRLHRAVEPVLDVMQTLPTFVYLIPAVALFSIGKPPGVIATVIFALPSMIRLTELGIRQVPGNVREAANAFGASPLQLLFKVELPLAVPSIRLGVNQTIMMSLSMVVVAALIGAGGLGDGVMKALQHLRTGQGFLVGFAIVLCAMVLDRMVRGAETERRKDGG